MTKIVYNACYGGFSLSDEAIEMYLQLRGFPFEKEIDKYGYAHYVVQGWDDFYDRYLERSDPVLIEVVEKLGDRANGTCAKLCIEDIPKGTLYRIDEYDGYESIETQNDIEWSVA
jgi:hypothetical protein